MRIASAASPSTPSCSKARSCTARWTEACDCGDGLLAPTENVGACWDRIVMAAEVFDSTPSPVASTPLQLRNRPWHVFSCRLNARLDELAGTEAWSMDQAETAETILELQRAQAKLAAA